MYISTFNGISCRMIHSVTMDEELRRRDSKYVKDIISRLENGEDASLKKQLPYRCPNGNLIDMQRVGVRSLNTMEGNGRGIIDLDESGSFAKALKRLDGQYELMGILNVEYSTRKYLEKGHLDVTLIKGLETPELTIAWWTKYLDINADMSTKDISRAVFLVPTSHQIYTHPDYYEDKVEPIDLGLSYNEIKEVMDSVYGEVKTRQTATSYVPTFTSTYTPVTVDDSYARTYMRDADEMIHLVEKVIERYQIDITGGEPQWFRIACAMNAILGAEGEDYFHRVSRFYPNYNRSEAQKKWEHVMAKGYSKVGLGTFVYYLMNNLTESQKAEVFNKI